MIEPRFEGGKGCGGFNRQTPITSCGGTDLGRMPNLVYDPVMPVISQSVFP
jgi:hypothetical protein